MMVAPVAAGAAVPPHANAANMATASKANLPTGTGPTLPPNSGRYQPGNRRLLPISLPLSGTGQLLDRGGKRGTRVARTGEGGGDHDQHAERRRGQEKLSIKVLLHEQRAQPGTDRAPREGTGDEQRRGSATHLARDVGGPVLHGRMEDRGAAADQEAGA